MGSTISCYSLRTVGPSAQPSRRARARHRCSRVGAAADEPPGRCPGAAAKLGAGALEAAASGWCLPCSSLKVVAVRPLISAAPLRWRDRCAGGQVLDSNALLGPSGGGCSAVPCGEGSCASAVSQHAEENRQPDDGDGLLRSLADLLEGQ